MIRMRIRQTFIHLLRNNTSLPPESHSLRSLSTSLASSEPLLRNRQFSPESLKAPQTSDSILPFLKKCGFSDTHLDKIVKSRPEVLSSSLDNTIKPKIKIFQDLGFRSSEIAEIISKEPTILFCSAGNRVIPSLSVLKGLLGSNEEVAKLLRRSGWFLTRDLEKTMVPNVEFLRSRGIPLMHILSLLHAYPRILLHQPDIMRKFVDKIEEMGADRSSKLFLYGVRVLGSMTNESWELKLQAFRDLGFSENDILTMFRNVPQAFAVSIEKITRIREVLLATGKYDMSCIVKHPRSLTSSVGNRLVPRLRVLGILEKKNLIEKWPGLGRVTTMTDEKFFERFVAPYLDEVGKEYDMKSIVWSTRGRKFME